MNKILKKKYAIALVIIFALLIAWRTLGPSLDLGPKESSSCLSEAWINYRDDESFFSVCYPQTWERITDNPAPNIRLVVSNRDHKDYLDMQIIVNYKQQLEGISSYDYVSAQSGEERVESINAETGMNNVQLREFQLIALANNPAYLLEIDYDYVSVGQRIPFVMLKFLTLKNGYEYQIIFRVHSSYYEYIKPELFEVANSFMIHDALRRR